MDDHSSERVCAGESRIDELERELAFAKRELEIHQTGDILSNADVYHSAKYWRDRCLWAENNLNAINVKYADLRNRKASE